MAKIIIFFGSDFFAVAYSQPHCEPALSVRRGNVKEPPDFSSFSSFSWFSSSFSRFLANFSLWGGGEHSAPWPPPRGYATAFLSTPNALCPFTSMDQKKKWCRHCSWQKKTTLDAFILLPIWAKAYSIYIWWQNRGKGKTQEFRICTVFRAFWPYILIPRKQT